MLVSGIHLSIAAPVSSSAAGLQRWTLHKALPKEMGDREATQISQTSL